MACQHATACLILYPRLHSLSLEQVEDITAVHEAAMLQLENNHLVAITVLQDENDCKIQGKPKTTQWLQSYSRAGISTGARLCKPGFSSSRADDTEDWCWPSAFAWGGPPGSL